MLSSVPPFLVFMTFEFPRRSVAAQIGPRLEISPLEIKNWLEHPSGHGLSKLLMDCAAWDPFCWKGQDLSAPMRALWLAEKNGLLSKRGDRAVDVPIAAVQNDINVWLLERGRRAVTENAVLNNLRTASQYVTAAVGVTLMPDRHAMTIRLVDHYENATNIETYFNQMLPKLRNLNQQLDHAVACNYDIGHILATYEGKTGLRVLPARAAAAN